MISTTKNDKSLKKCLECGKEFDPGPEDESFCCYDCYEWHELLRTDGY